jgi:sugar O-acyltransferase (sialic acid O-acetyltransferase NeuD family)
MPTVIMIGNGGHARVLLATLRLTGTEIAGFTLDPLARVQATPNAIDVMSDEELLARSPSLHLLVNGIGGADVPRLRRSVYDQFGQAGFSFMRVVHPSAVIAADAEIGDGAQIMAGAIVQPAVKIGDNVILNTRTVVEHDCVIGDHVHVATGALLTGNVTVGRSTMIGAGAIVRQGVRIGEGVLVAAGAVIVSNVPDGARMAGVPARPMRLAPTDGPA